MKAGNENVTLGDGKKRSYSQRKDHGGFIKKSPCV